MTFPTNTFINFRQVHTDPDCAIGFRDDNHSGTPVSRFCYAGDHPHALHSLKLSLNLWQEWYCNSLRGVQGIRLCILSQLDGVIVFQSSQTLEKFGNFWTTDSSACTGPTSDTIFRPSITGLLRRGLSSPSTKKISCLSSTLFLFRWAVNFPKYFR